MSAAVAWEAPIWRVNTTRLSIRASKPWLYVEWPFQSPGGSWKYDSSRSTENTHAEESALYVDFSRPSGDIARMALDLKLAAELTYEIQNDRMIFTKPTKQPVDDPFVTFAEWDSEAGRKAYAAF